ncbi:MAG TPA: tetratricopeptide repeat protein [Candidatus Binatus sp.]|uniref:tetratricopeptide repeat protein n=1 Tax=Candidatus Binatus sp. TaxID=2811406 RepID=UPI002B45D322|nr:tetratricopeptide repeat protein [Candidatus Binatus sp.]HKN14193.1 tetratricopeptide repeat protein [Candidatus Binatus sp.]
MNSDVNMTGRLGGKLRLSRVLAVVIAALGFLAIASSSNAASANRAESDAVVAEAEKLVMQAGQADPVDTKLIHQAMDKLHVALKIDPRNDSAYVDLGFCYGVLRDGDTAIGMYRTATELNPSGSNFIELADVYLRVGDAEDALLAANAGIVKDPSNARLYNAKGLALNDLQRFDEAEEAWEKALRLNPNLKVAQANLDALNAGATGRGSISKHSAQPPASSPPH